ncbi:MAG TPA: NAD(P)-binding domain-containing protein [Actinomycetota bacterium]
MRVAVLGTGTVGRTLAGRLAGLGHETRVGTRDVEASLARTTESWDGSGTFAQWHANTPDVPIATFADAASGAEVVFNATAGDGSLEALGSAGDLDGVVIADVSNPLDHSQGFPPLLSVCNDDSLAERIQRAHPGARVVKTLNTVTAAVMVRPADVADGDHTMFVAGDDGAAKATVRSLLEAFGWRHVIDLGGIRGARAMEMYLPLWLQLMGARESPMFNVKVVA